MLCKSRSLPTLVQLTTPQPGDLNIIKPPNQSTTTNISPKRSAMDPCPFVRLLVGNLALKFPAATRPALAGVHPSSTPCFCTIRLSHLPSHTAPLPLLPPDSTHPPPSPAAAVFHLSRADVARAKPLFSFRSGAVSIKIAIYTGRRGSTCGIASRRLLGKVVIPVDLKAAEGRGCVFHSGWVGVGGGGKGSAAAQVHLTVRSEPDPRFVFEFDAEPGCSPQIFQVEGARRQPVFTCKFSCRSDWSKFSSRSSPLASSTVRKWLSAFGSSEEQPTKERKGWSITVHDLSGSPVALASMVTPFVASSGTDRVLRSNPGAWLILRPGDNTWKPWGRLEAWRERGGGTDALGYRFDVLPDTHMTDSFTLAESTISAGKGGKFCIDLTGNAAAAFSPGCSPRESGDFGYGLWPFASYRGFVMSSTVGGEGKSRRPVVEVAVQHVGCTEDAAAYVALAAAIDLSMDACRLFSHRLRRELSRRTE